MNKNLNQELADRLISETYIKNRAKQLIAMYSKEHIDKEELILELLDLCKAGRDIYFLDCENSAIRYTRALIKGLLSEVNSYE
jgi:hypothetical protein